MNVAIIPARGGSKRIPGKNIKIFAGKPIISYSIKAALESNLFDRVIVSTDSERIAEVAVSCGAEVPFLRPVALADDFTPFAPIMLNTLEWLEKDGVLPEYFCCLLATAPFVVPEYLQQGFDLLKARQVSGVFSVTSFSFPIFRALRIDEDDGHLSMFWPEHEMTRSNDLPEAYHDAGQFYWLERRKFLKEPRFYRQDALPQIVPRYLVQDIDTPEDWYNAEIMFEVVARKKRDLAKFGGVNGKV